MNIYFSGIGGVGIGPLAEIAYEAGYNVQGSDLSESLMTRQLEKKSIALHIGEQDGSFLQSCQDNMPLDWLVYSSALPANHPELLLARQLSIKTVKRDELLARIISEKNLKLIAIAGTHGKTTTTGMMIWALQQLGVPVSYSVGTTLSFGPSGKFDPASEYFVYECDEFDRNFLTFRPYLSLITSIDYDHTDTYGTERDYSEAFKEFGLGSTRLITWQDQQANLFDSHPDAWILNSSETMKLTLPGAHNRQNATLVIKALEKLGLSHDVSLVESFPGTNRRFEKLAENLYSDYGHHPVEIAATLQMARELSNQVVLVYQPHQNIRQLEFVNDYSNQFELAEDIYWLPTYLSREDPSLGILTPEELTQTITNKDSVHVADLNDELWNTIQKARKEGILVLCMGAGSIDEWVRKKLPV